MASIPMPQASAGAITRPEYASRGDAPLAPVPLTGASEQPLVLAGLPAVVKSPSMYAVLTLARKVARTNAAVLVTGESGTGKEVVARAIHHFSLRCTRPLVDVNCGALPGELMESELFGYERGAFSGAATSKQGMFELAHTGTLFLDEVGELDPRMQVKLLRVLDGVPYYRLGGVRKVSADVRIVAATNRNLEEAVAAGQFRRDLFHRLNEVRISVPPLRERPADVEALAEYFLQQQRPDLVFGPAAMECLRSHSWPGNVRELRNVVTRAAIEAEDAVILPDNLPVELRSPGEDATPAACLRLDGLEQETIFKALSETGGHQGRAAELLGISRRTLIRKLKCYYGTTRRHSLTRARECNS